MGRTNAFVQRQYISAVNFTEAAGGAEHGVSYISPSEALDRTLSGLCRNKTPALGGHLRCPADVRIWSTLF